MVLYSLPARMHDMGDGRLLRIPRGANGRARRRRVGNPNSGLKLWSKCIRGLKLTKLMTLETAGGEVLPKVTISCFRRERSTEPDQRNQGKKVVGVCTECREKEQGSRSTCVAKSMQEKIIGQI